MEVSFIRSKMVYSGAQYFLGVGLGQRQIRVGFIFFQIVIAFRAPLEDVAAGNHLMGGVVYYYRDGTLTPKATYLDEGAGNE